MKKSNHSRSAATKAAQAVTTAAVLAVAASSAFAAHIPGENLVPQQFTVTPTAVGEPNASFAAQAIDFSYRADISQVGTGPTSGTFTENGVGFFSTFQNPLSNPLNGATTGLNNNYRMYASFTGAGDVVAANGGVNGTFRNFNLTFFVDTNGDTNFVGDTTGLSGAGEDVRVLTGTLSVGGFHVYPGLVNGDYDVKINATPIGNFFGGTAFAFNPVVDFNGVNSFFSGISPPPSTFSNGHIRGSGNVQVSAIPEPETYALMLAGLGVVGFIARRRKAMRA